MIRIASKGCLTVTMAFGLYIQGCGPSEGLDSEIKGHFEVYDSSKVFNYLDSQRVVAEFNPSQAVIVSLRSITRYDKDELLAAILAADVQNLYIMVPDDYYGNVFQSKEFAKLRSLTRHHLNKIVLVPHTRSGRGSVWARDWSPLFTAANDSSSLRILDFNYHSSERKTDDAVPRTLEEHFHWERVSIPVYNEGGNFMINNRNECLLTTRITDANKEKTFRDDYVFDNEQLTSLLNNFAGCEKTHIFPRMPYEGTGHIDIWAKFLNDDLVLVNQLSNESLNLIQNQEELNAAKEVQAYLEARASDLVELGYQIVRIPMPTPYILNDVIRSYTNSLLLNNKAIIPRYIKKQKSHPDSLPKKNKSHPQLIDLAADLGVSLSRIRQTWGNAPYVDNALLQQYEESVAKAYRDAGFEPVFIDSDNLIYEGGAIHCITMQIPEGNLTSKASPAPTPAPPTLPSPPIAAF